MAWALGRHKRKASDSITYDLLGDDSEKQIPPAAAAPADRLSLDFFGSMRSRRLAGLAGTALLLAALLFVAISRGMRRIPPPLPLRQEPVPNARLNAFLRSHFSAEADVVQWTMATGAPPSYVPSARNWDRRRAELDMPDTVVVFCLDRECLEECERTGLRAYDGYLKGEVVIPDPSGARRRLWKRTGAERGHVMAYLKFQAMLDMAQSGFFNLFFEGDTWLTTDPFNYMLSRKDDSWDVQFTEDGNYLLNFGWIYARPSPATVQLFAHALNQYLAHNEWDQELLCKMVRRLGGREWVGENGRQHWWLVDRIGLRMFMLPLNQFFPYHLEFYDLPEEKMTPVMHHLSGVNFANREFYPKERGWAADVDGFYSRPRPILTGSSVNTTLRAGAHYARLLNVVAAQMRWAMQVPEGMTLTGREGKSDWTYTRTWTRFMSVEAAITNGLDLLEHDFFVHAQRYAPASVLHSWASARVQVDLAAFTSLDKLVGYLESLSIPRDRGGIVELVGFDDPASNAAQWRLDSHSVRSVPQAFREVPVCRSFNAHNIPYEWCYPLPLSYA